jgi:hypothetical protein
VITNRRGEELLSKPGHRQDDGYGDGCRIRLTDVHAGSRILLPDNV